MDAYLAQLIQEGSEVSPLHTFAYDAVWLVARAVSQVMEAAKHRERMSKNGSVSEEQLHRMLLDAVATANFTGVTVRTHTSDQLFNTNIIEGNHFLMDIFCQGDVFFGGGDRMTSIELIQLQGTYTVCVCVCLCVLWTHSDSVCVSVSRQRRRVGGTLLDIQPAAEPKDAPAAVPR